MSGRAARSLLGVTLRTAQGATRADVVLPFFSDRLDVRLLLVLGEDGRFVVTRDLPQKVGRRTLTYLFEPRFEPFPGAAIRELTTLLHFDPWWLMKGREDVPPAGRDAVMATNIAGRELAGGKLQGLYYDSDLETVTGAAITKGLFRRKIGRDELLAEL